MAPYEALYGRLCRSPIYWIKMGERSITGSDLIRDTSEKVDLIRKCLFTTQSRHMSYVCETPENSNFLKKGKIVISVKI